ncbi:hypothetical protein [Amycolatopsis pretoriensis]|uniref:hypothetical protein n=1 Tax=Amycolatopsis pretoriensis TaxID=218821 RepID=UPI000A39BA46|nr:hypothetical protein [Amycolatopsis pretoriensis]
MALFAERRCEHTTVGDITERVVVGRTTFFRAPRAKEDVIFPNDDVLLEAVESRLAGSNTGINGSASSQSSSGANRNDNRSTTTKIIAHQRPIIR